MYGLIFELDANLLQDDYQITRPKAYSVIDKTLTDMGFTRIQCNFYVLQNPKNGMNFLFDVNDELGKYEWFNACVHDIAAFKLEDWSDITESFKKKL